MIKKELNGLLLEELEEYMKSIGAQKFRAEQLFVHFHKHRSWDIESLSLLPKKLREKLRDRAQVNQIKLYKRYDSKIDDTKKYLFLLEDDNIIESVAMNYKHGTTVCVSTQVGCQMGCAFCASTKDGLIRNLTAAEILNQVYMIEEDQGIEVSNIVLMGSGEPLDNYQNTLQFLKLIHHEKGHNISYRNISLSTCGIVPRIYELADEEIPVTLTISLHSAFDEERRKIMPVGKKYSIEEIIQACKYYESKNNRRISFEYTLIDGVNDRIEDAIEISKILRGLNSHVNLIPLNPIEEYGKERSTRANIKRFEGELSKRNIEVTIRREMGGDISASCGQLRRSVIE